MRCPYCGNLDDRVVDTRVVRDGRAIWRRRECLHCGRRFTTYEEIEELRITVIKRDGRREAFDREKLARGIALACNKRPISTDQIQEIVDEVERALYNRGVREVSSKEVGELVMERLRELDPVAYIRFASVYLNVQDVQAFRKLLQEFPGPLKRR